MWLTEEGDEDEEDDTGGAGHVCDGLVGWCKWCADLDLELDLGLEIGFEFGGLSVQSWFKTDLGTRAGRAGTVSWGLYL